MKLHNLIEGFTPNALGKGWDLGTILTGSSGKRAPKLAKRRSAKKRRKAARDSRRRNRNR